MKVNLLEIEEGVRRAAAVPLPEFPYEFLKAFNTPRATIDKLKIAEVKPGHLSLRGRLAFEPAPDGKADEVLDRMRATIKGGKNAPRFLVSSDGKELRAFDRVNQDLIAVTVDDMIDAVVFFLPLADIEFAQDVKENSADVLATIKLGWIYDKILLTNPEMKEMDRHALNVFLTRLLFCFFADDTGLFEKDSFGSLAAVHLDNMQSFLSDAFTVMGRKPSERQGLPGVLCSRFPYVNGKLFDATKGMERIKIPLISKDAARGIVSAGKLNWSQINPDIFGAMIQVIAHDKLRSELGMHYTSVTNIMRVLKPMFVDELNTQISEANQSAANERRKKLNMLLGRVRNIRVFDPACGSGNFLIVAYKELRKIEMECLKGLREVEDQFALPTPGIMLNHFMGIETDDFACETAKLSLWIAEHQQNVAFKEIFSVTPPTLPLSSPVKIEHGNALRSDWFSICGVTPRPAEDEKKTDRKSFPFELFVVGNPPFQGSQGQAQIQKDDIKLIFKPLGIQGFGELDYVACWWIKAAEFVAKTGFKAALVSTNSICQGEQPCILWPHILDCLKLEIEFAYTSFVWSNSARRNAGVDCVIICVRTKDRRPKKLITDEVARIVPHIGPYLTESDNTTVVPRATPLVDLPRMIYGNMANDGGHLIMETAEERDQMGEAIEEFIKQNPLGDDEARILRGMVKPLLGSESYLQGIERWCLWIQDKDAELARRIQAIDDRVKAVLLSREKSDRLTTKRLAQWPHAFGEIRIQPTPCIFVPAYSSRSRDYYPVAFMPGNEVISNLGFAVLEDDPWVFGVMCSMMHMAWIEGIAGKMRLDPRYSPKVIWNTFPLPALSEDQKKMLADHGQHILDVREAHYEMTPGDLYNRNKIPADLLKAHRELDADFERSVFGKTFEKNIDRLNHLFRLYNRLAPENRKNAA